ncbi:TIGR03943 family putative permease subunit ['Paenibacillus yunnanensis' Narsing Rao et al. 2020]|uniref:TIGR03943 family putative permease subunit n=1 Tax=Paenibacillus tengchongensis TaxID=2608684 RepID=UPI001652A314|nr:TIGR03943 family protein [Paenibacillus tengchongensis]
MNDPRVIRVHYMLRAAILLLFALFIAHLVQQDALHYYVAPRLARWVRLCPLPLVLMALSLALQALFGKRGDLCDCEHRLPASGVAGGALYSLFLFPLLLGLLLPDRALGSAAAARKGFEFAYTSPEAGNRSPGGFSAEDPYEAEFAALAGRLHSLPVIPVLPELFSETVGAMNLYKEQFAGKSVQVTGFLYREKGPGGLETFAVSRFLVQCCTADATPVGILLHPQTPISLPADTWIQVRGKLAVISYGSGDVIGLVPDEIRTVTQPAAPYVYTSADSVAAWDELSSAAGY